MHAGRKSLFAAAVGLSFLLSMCVAGQEPLNPSSVNVAQPLVSYPAARELRFPVAVQHGGGWCYGYLHGSEDRVRLEIVQPQADQGYSFEAPRAEVAIRQWIILGQPQDAIELKTRTATYHLRWLANPEEVNTGKARRWAPPASLSPYGLIAAMQNPSAVLAQGARAGNSSLNAGSAPPPASPQPEANPASASPVAITDDRPQDLPPGMLAGVYVSTATSDLKPANTQYLFYPDGLVMNGLPQEGMLGFDFSHYRPQNNPDRNWVGRYKVEGDFIQIVWINQFSDPSKPDVVERNEVSAHPPLRFGARVFIPMCRCTGKRLSGTYRWGAPAADQFVQFFPDGTFIDHRVMDQMIVPSPFFEHPRIQRGTYEIARQTIVFTFADGHRGARTFLAPKVQQDNPTFDWISLGWHMMFEEGYAARLGR